MQMLLNILILTVAIFAVAQLMPTIRIKNFGTAVVVAIVYSLINFFIGWLLYFLALPFIVITLGLFTFVVNALMLWATDKLIEDFEIQGIVSTLIAAFFISLAQWIIKVILF